MAKIIKIILPVNIITSFFSTIVKEEKGFLYYFICSLSIDNMTVFDYDFGINENKDTS